MKIKLLILSIAIFGIVNAQSTWTQKTNFGGGVRQSAVSFSIGTKGYMGTGFSGTNKQDFWEWNQATNTWTQKANFPGPARQQLVGFSIGTKGYLGTGWTPGAMYNDFWEWNQATNTWAQKANFGGTGYDGNDKKNDFWEWDQATDSWMQKADFGGTPRQAASGFSISNKGYIGTGYDGAGWQQDFWEWDPSVNQWFQRADFGGTGRWDAVGFSVGTKGYIGTGFDGTNIKNDFWEFNPVSSPPICLVTVDSLSHYSIIAWDKTPYTDVDSFIVYREYTTNNYLPIGAVSYNSLSQFTDTVRVQYFPVTGDPNISSYRYKLQIRDISGNYSSLGLYHNTIHILNNNGNFSWNFYEIENTPNPVTFYELKRDNLNDGHWITVAGVAGTQNSISDPQYSTYQNTANWRIETQWNISCDLTRTTSDIMTAISKSRSNLLKTNTTGINEVAIENMITISPNPSNGKFTIELSSSGVPNNSKYVVKIYNVLGEQIYLSELKQLSQNEIDLSNVPKGIYFVNVYNGDKIYTRKIVKQ